MNDKLLILEDTNGDGKADKCTMFADDLNNPTGFEFWNGGVLVAQQPNLVFLKDTNGDDKYDIEGDPPARPRLGRHAPHDQQLHARSGRRALLQEGMFHHTQVETPWGPALRQADGGVFRFEPRTWKFEIYVPMNFANPHGHVFDRWGHDIVVDGTGGQPYYGPSFSTKKYFPAMETKQGAEARATCARGPSAASRSSRAATSPRRCRATCSCSTSSASRAF